MGFPPQGWIPTVITAAVILASGFLGQTNYWTGVQHFSTNIALDTGQLNYSNHIISFPANTITVVGQNSTWTHTINTNESPQINYSGHQYTFPANTMTVGGLNITQQWTGQNNFTHTRNFHTGSEIYVSGAFIQRNPAYTYTTTFNGPAVGSNQTYTWFGQPLVNSTAQLSGNGTMTTSTSPVMDGVYDTLTPQQDTRIEVSAQGVMYNSVSGDGCRLDVRYSTSATANGGATTGTTVIGAWVKANSTGTAQMIPFKLAGFATSLTVGTKYYFDITEAAITGGQCHVLNVGWNNKEI